MQLVETKPNAAPQTREPITASELEYIAFTGQHEIAHGIFRGIAKEHRSHYVNKYILSEVIAGGIKKLRTFLSVSAETAANEEKAFIGETMDLFVESSRNSDITPRELFESLLLWADELTKLSLLQEALQYYDEALALGVNKFPELYVRCLFGKASVLNLTGKFRETQSLLASLAERPYIIADRNLIPELLFNLGKESLLKGDVALYKKLLFRGLRHYYSRIENRRVFVDQIRKTYRRSLNVLFDPQLSSSNKVLFVIHRIYFLVQRFAVGRHIGLAKAMELAVLGYVYSLNYFFPSSSSPQKELVDGRATALHPSRRGKNILITRAMGGIGDLLMMTPGFHALKEKHPDEEIHLAIPKRYFPLFQGNRDVLLKDVENEAFDHYGYRKWFNFTDCPAARVESRTAPKVKKDRIELFARGLGISPLSVHRMEKLPRYFVLPEERAFQLSFWNEHGLEGKTVIGVQLHSDEVYRDYPHMQRMVELLARTYHVVVFDTEAIHGYDDVNISKVSGLPMRKAFALAAACNAIVAPDSAFVHLAAAFDIPCIALYGPVDGEIRTMHYPKCTYLDVRNKLGCMPCWRNDKIPCKLTNMRTSVCMADISINEIHTALNEALKKEHRQ